MRVPKLSSVIRHSQDYFMPQTWRLITKWICWEIYKYIVKGEDWYSLYFRWRVLQAMKRIKNFSLVTKAHGPKKYKSFFNVRIEVVDEDTLHSRDTAKFRLILIFNDRHTVYTDHSFIFTMTEFLPGDIPSVEKLKIELLFSVSAYRKIIPAKHKKDFYCDLSYYDKEDSAKDYDYSVDIDFEGSGCAPRIGLRNIFDR